MDCKQCIKTHNNKTFCSRKCKGRWQSKNLRGINNHNYGNYATDEFRKLVSDKTKEAMKDLILPQTGKSRPKNIREKISESVKEYWKNNIHPMKGKTVEDFFGKKRGCQLREKNRETTIKQLKNGSMLNKETSIEKLFKEELENRNIDYEFQKSFKLGIADFYLPKLDMYVFCDGNYWHNYPNGKKRDLKQVEHLESNGFRVYRFWGSEIRKNVGGIVEWMLVKR